jgi:hypothetical protein
MGVNSCAGTAAVSSWNQRLLQLPPLQRLHNSENHTISSRHYSLLPEFQGLRAVAATTATGVGGGGISSVSDITTLLKTPALSNLSGVAGTIFFLFPSSHLRFFPSGFRVFPSGCSTTNNLSTNRECFFVFCAKISTQILNPLIIIINNNNIFFFSNCGEVSTAGGA